MGCRLCLVVSGWHRGCASSHYWSRELNWRRFKRATALKGRSFIVACAALLFAGHAAQAQTGIASIYAYAGSKTASGQRAIQTGSRRHIARCRLGPKSKSPNAAMARRSKCGSMIADHSFADVSSTSHRLRRGRWDFPGSHIRRDLIHVVIGGKADMARRAAKSPNDQSGHGLWQFCADDASQQSSMHVSNHVDTNKRQGK